MSVSIYNISIGPIGFAIRVGQKIKQSGMDVFVFFCHVLI
jgi:methylglyoxal synthase